MKKDIVIKKNRTHRIGIRVLSVLSIGFTVTLTMYMKQGNMILLCLPWLLISGCLLCYYETWQICFNSNAVHKKVFFWNCGTYSYLQMKDVTRSYSYTEHEYICICFADGKYFRFRSEDENADKAIVQICKHRTIRME